MTHKLFELDKMNREQLEAIATELNIKGIKKIDSENLAYQILDAEARQESVKPTPEPAQPKARRGRPKKAAEEAKPAEAADSKVQAQEAAKPEKPAAKQGRQLPEQNDQLMLSRILGGKP